MKYIIISIMGNHELINFARLFHENNLDYEVSSNSITVFFEDSQLELVLRVLRENQERNIRLREIHKGFQNGTLKQVKINWETLEVKK